LATAIKEKFDIEPDLIRSGGGVFEVVSDGKLIFSKRQKFRFPDNQEIIEILKKM
jgi:selT/selW/selH-like putative selenoprotein